MSVFAQHLRDKLGLSRVRVSRVSSVPDPGGRRGQPKWPGLEGNPRGQLVGCRQRGAYLVAASTRNPEGKLGLARVRVS